MAHRMPRSMGELAELLLAGSSVEGYGVHVATVLACPFCGTPDFMRLMPAKMMMQDGDYAVTGTCGRCGRSAECRITRDSGVAAISELVQVGGDPQPEWLSPSIAVGEPTEGALSW